MKTYAIAGLAAALLTAPLAASARDTKLSKKQMPAAVTTTVEKKYPGAKQTGYEKEEEDGKTAYEVKLEQGKQKLEVSLAEDGKVISEESVIARKDLPGPVARALAASKYGKWKAIKAEKIVAFADADAQKVSYEVALRDGKQTAEVVFEASGAIAKEETKKAGEKD